MFKIVIHMGYIWGCDMREELDGFPSGYTVTQSVNSCSPDFLVCSKDTLLIPSPNSTGCNYYKFIIRFNA